MTIVPVHRRIVRVASSSRKAGWYPQHSPGPRMRSLPGGSVSVECGGRSETSRPSVGLADEAGHAPPNPYTPEKSA